MKHDSGRLAEFRAAATAAAELTFERFRDEPDSDYYQASGRTPERTWQEVRERVGLVSAEAVALAIQDATLTPGTFCGWHRSIFETTFPAARLFAKLLSAHPFNDGNGRACYVALQFALVRLGALFVSLPDYAEQQWHLGRALRTGGGQSYEPLARYLAEKIRAAEDKGLQSEEP